MPKIKIERKTDWTLRKAHPEDKGAIREFYKHNMWKTKDSTFLYKWKFENNPFGEAIMYVGINSKGDVVSNCAFMPWLFCINEKQLMATQVVDGVTQLEYRGQGIPFEQMRLGIDEFKRKGAPICLAFPNENGASVHRQNKSIHLGRILRYTKPLRSEYIVGRVVKSKILAKMIGFFANIGLKLFSKETYFLNSRKFEIEKPLGPSAEFDNFWNNMKSKIGSRIITEKNNAYIHWKYIASPNNGRQIYLLRRKGCISGFIVLESTPDIGYIIDLLAVDKTAIERLIAYAIKYFRRQHKNSVVFSALEQNMYIEDFKDFGFVERPEEKHFYIYMDENTENKEFFMDPKNWFITIGDCDIERL